MKDVTTEVERFKAKGFQLDEDGIEALEEFCVDHLTTIELLQLFCEKNGATATKEDNKIMIRPSRREPKAVEVDDINVEAEHGDFLGWIQAKEEDENGSEILHLAKDDDKTTITYSGKKQLKAGDQIHAGEVVGE